jgi:hypothetical protein
MSVSAFAFTPSSALLPTAPHSTFTAPPPTTAAAALPLHSQGGLLSSSSLLDCIEAKTRQARSSGALQTIHTRCHLIKDTKTMIDERSPLLVRLFELYSDPKPFGSLTPLGSKQFPVRIKTEGAAYNKPDVLTDNIGCASLGSAHSGVCGTPARVQLAVC